MGNLRGGYEIVGEGELVADMPLFWDAELLKKNVHAARLHKGLPSRFAIVPRHGGEVCWFEASPTYVLHWVNAYEQGDGVILDGYFQEEPEPLMAVSAPSHPSADSG